MTSLLVSLPLEPAVGATEWAYAVRADDGTLADQGRAPAALLPLPRGAGAEVVAIVPVQALAWHRLALPKGVGPGSPRLRSALEGLLEEQLLDDPDAVHLALAPDARPGDSAWVAVCDRAWLRNALQALEAAGRSVNRIVPEIAPEEPASWTVMGDANQPTVVASGAEGVLILPLTAGTAAVLPSLPEGAGRFAEPAVAAAAEQLVPQPWTLQQAPQRWLRAARGGWDLAQFEFASSARARALKKFAAGWSDLLHAPAWRLARWGAAALVAVNLLGLNAWAWKERASLEQKREAVRATLRETFPQVKLVVDAPVQMEREVAALRQQTGASSTRDLDAQLAALASALPAGRSPSRVEYAGSQLRAVGLTLSADEFRSVAARLKGLGYATTREGDAVVLAAEDIR